MSCVSQCWLIDKTWRGRGTPYSRIRYNEVRSMTRPFLQWFVHSIWSVVVVALDSSAAELSSTTTRTKITIPYRCSHSVSLQCTYIPANPTRALRPTSLIPVSPPGNETDAIAAAAETPGEQDEVVASVCSEGYGEDFESDD